MTLSTVPVIQALYTVLTNDTTLMALISGVYDRVPEDAAFPYLTLGEVSTRDHSGVASTVLEHTLTLEVWSRYRGGKQALDIMNRLHTLLDGGVLILTSQTFVGMRYDTSDIRMLADGVTYKGSIDIRIMTSEA